MMDYLYDGDCHDETTLWDVLASFVIILAMTPFLIPLALWERFK